jgi:hypothetical protein
MGYYKLIASNKSLYKPEDGSFFKSRGGAAISKLRKSYSIDTAAPNLVGRASQGSG